MDSAARLVTEAIVLYRSGCSAGDAFDLASSRACASPASVRRARLVFNASLERERRRDDALLALAAVLAGVPAIDLLTSLRAFVEAAERLTEAIADGDLSGAMCLLWAFEDHADRILERLNES